MPDTHEMIRQHHELISLCEKLDEAVRQRRPRDEIYPIMDELIACTEHHFAAEEQLMAEVGYPELEGHKARHKELLERTRKFRRRLELYGEEKFTEWFNHWPFPFILAHIQNGDHQIADHIHLTSQAAEPARKPAVTRADLARIVADMSRALERDSSSNMEIKVPKELRALTQAKDAAIGRAAIEKPWSALHLHRQDD